MKDEWIIDGLNWMCFEGGTNVFCVMYDLYDGVDNLIIVNIPVGMW